MSALRWNDVGPQTLVIRNRQLLFTLSTIVWDQQIKMIGLGSLIMTTNKKSVHECSIQLLTPDLPPTNQSKRATMMAYDDYSWKGDEESALCCVGKSEIFLRSTNQMNDGASCRVDTFFVTIGRERCATKRSR